MPPPNTAKIKMSRTSKSEQKVLTQHPGDILIPHSAIPDCSIALSGTTKRRGARNWTPEPRFSLTTVRQFIEFLEKVVTSERIIVPHFSPSKDVQKAISDERNEELFAVYRLAGDIDFDQDSLISMLTAHKILFEAEVESELGKIDEYTRRLLPNSKFLSHIMKVALAAARRENSPDPETAALAVVSHFHGEPIYLAHLSERWGTPFMPSEFSNRLNRGYEKEARAISKRISDLMLDKLNQGAREQIERINSVLGTHHLFVTPIGNHLLDGAKSPLDMVENAIALRSSFREFRIYSQRLQSIISSEKHSIKEKTDAIREIEFTLNNLWPTKQAKGVIRHTAEIVASSASEIPELMVDPISAAPASLLKKALSLPTEKIAMLLKTHRTRALLKTKKSFLKSSSTTQKIARAFCVPVELVRASVLDEA